MYQKGILDQGAVLSGRGGQVLVRDELFSRPREQCGVFAVHNYKGPGSAAAMAYLGLLALQHRGQESAGMAYTTKDGLVVDKGMGLVEQVFDRQILDSVRSAGVLGHVRYSTSGTSSLTNAQPLLARSLDRISIAIAHNGNLSNTRKLRQRLLGEGHIFHGSSDTEIILTYLFRFRKMGLIRAVRKTMGLIRGAYTVALTDGSRLVAFRDPHGFRPLVLGRLGEAHIVASESAALDSVGGQFIRDVAPGEILSLGPDGIYTEHCGIRAKPSLCLFEYVYFARPDSIIDGVSVHQARRDVGAALASRLQCLPDFVIPSPDSGISAAIGLAETLRRPLEWAVHRNPYLGRTFIEPSAGERALAVRLKFNPVAAVVKGRRIAIVDDSLVRGTTARVLTGLLRAAGAKEVHLCIASPPYSHPCYYGIDIPLAADLASQGGAGNNLAESVGADSVVFATPEDLYQAVGSRGDGYCTACFTGRYPTLEQSGGMVKASEAFSG